MFILKLVGTVVGAGICGITLAYVAFSILTKNNELPSGNRGKETSIEANSNEIANSEGGSSTAVSNTSVFYFRYHPLLDLPASLPTFHAIFFQSIYGCIQSLYPCTSSSLSLLHTDNLPPAVSPAYFGIKKAFSSHKIKRRKGFSSVVPLLFIRHPADALIRFCNGNSRFCLSWIIPVQQKNSKVSSESMILPLTTRQLSEIRRIFLLVLFFAFAIY